MPETVVAPDPAQTTMTDIAPVPANEDTDWTFLDDQGEAPNDPMVFEDDEASAEGLPASDEPAEEDATDAEVSPAEATTTDEPTPTEEPAAPVLDDETKEKLAQYEAYDEAMRTDPVAVANTLFEAMDARQRAAFLSQFSPQQSFDVESYEPQGEMEEHLKARWQDIEAIPHLVTETKRLEDTFQQQLTSRFDTLAPHISEANVQAQINAAKIDAILEALEMNLPDPDYGTVAKILADGKSTYKDAVRKAANYKSTVETQKQKRAPRPTTPGSNTGRQDMNFDDLADRDGHVSMVKIARALGTLR